MELLWQERASNWEGIFLMNTKYVVLLADGMSDYPVPELNNNTPLQCAFKPNMDKLASKSIVGLAKTIPEGLPPASDVANLSVMGYDPKKYYTGRSPLEAVSMGIEMAESDLSLRCNLVTLSEDEKYDKKMMLDHSSDEISSEEASKLMESISSCFNRQDIKFYSGVSYRHLMVWNKDNADLILEPPHDILGRQISDYLPQGNDSKVLLDMMVKSYNLLSDHPVNTKRKERGLKPANSIWLWGQGKKPHLPQFFDKFKKTGSVIAAVDLIKGIGLCAGLTSVNVHGATGNIHTDFEGKADAALKELDSGKDFVYIHVEAPDECGHRYEIDNKVKSIELIDKLVLGRILAGIRKYDNYKILILPDHPTPLSLRTHTEDPVPFILYDHAKEKNSFVDSYNELEAKKSGIFIDEGYKLLNMLFNSM